MKGAKQAPSTPTPALPSGGRAGALCPSISVLAQAGTDVLGQRRLSMIEYKRASAG